jgi:superfamily II DNA or RNA helicase
VVPTISLVHQLASDFVEYGCNPDWIHKILAGQEKTTDRSIVISTWQSLTEMDEEWFQQFSVIIGDEAHRFAAKSLTTIMEKLKDCPVRLGFTGSLDGSKCNAMVLTGLFGPIQHIISARELIDEGYASKLDVNVIILKHPDRIRQLKKMRYPDEVSYLIGCEPRNKFINKLVSSLDGNTLVLFYRREHGDLLYEMFKKKFPNRKIFLIHGDVDGEERNDMRGEVEEEDNAIIVASYGTTSTGINIKRLHNIIFASAWKSIITNMQSIGRGMRLAVGKDKCMLFDLSDDISWKKRRNHTLNHVYERIRLYNEQKFDYTVDRINLQY